MFHPSLAFILTFICFRYHSTMKTVTGHRSLRFPELLQIILDIFCLRMIDRDRKEVEASVKFPTQSIPSILKDFSQKVTRYAFELVNQQMKLSKTGYSIIKVIVLFFINFYLTHNVTNIFVFDLDRFIIPDYFWNE